MPAFLTGLLCAAAAFAWQAATVHWNYGGNWSALFCTSGEGSLPPAVAGENVYRFAGTAGWDGQFYHYIAHDPLDREGTSVFIDSPRQRYRRILVPGLAWLASLGQPGKTDTAYRCVILGFFFLGAYALSLVATGYGRHAGWGVLFFFVPAALTSLDRLAVDVSLAALCVAFAYLSREKPGSWQLFLVLAAAALARETGVLLTVAYCLWLAARRQIRGCLMFACALVPAGLWYAWVSWRTAPLAFPVPVPFSGMVDRLLHPMQYPAGPVAILAVALDYCALSGMLMAFAAVLLLARRRPVTPHVVAMLLFVALGIFGWRPGDWPEVTDYARILTPLLIFVALPAFEKARWVYLAPLFAIIPRCGLQFASQAFQIVKRLH